jgi:hypothetical protein
MRDTSPAAEAVRLAAIRRMEPAERLRQAFALSESVRALALARLRAAHPGRTDLELVELLLGTRLVPRAEPRPPR